MAGKVAVLAVHGVGKHAAGETQNTMADLLLSLPARNQSDAPRVYKEFKAVDLQIPLQRVKTAAYVPPGESPWHRITHLYQERSADFANDGKKISKTRKFAATAGKPALEYTSLLLREYEGGADGNVYRTSRLEGSGTADGKAGVHIYEVLWSDLAQPYNSVINFFLALFQLILHLASLSRLAIDSGAEEGGGAIWIAYRTIQRYAVRILQIFVPLVELILMIALASSLIEVWSTTRGKPWVMFALCAAGAVGVSILVIMNARRAVSEHPWLWALKAMMPFGVGVAIPAIVWFAWAGRASSAIDGAARADIASALFFWLVPGLACFLWVLNKYEDERKGVLVTGIVLYAVSLVLFCFLLTQAYPQQSAHADAQTVLVATLKTGTILLAAVRFFWLLMVICAFAAAALGSLAWRSMKGEARERARAAVRTSRLALALPAVLFFLVAMLIWAAFLGSTPKLMPQGSSYFTQEVIDQVQFPSWTQSALGLLPPEKLKKYDPQYLEPKKGKDDQPKNNYALRVFAWTMGNHLPVMLLVLSLNTFLLIWWALPSIFTEGVLPRGSSKPPRDSTDQASIRMGTWMSRGLDATSLITVLLWSAIFLVPVLYIAGSFFSSEPEKVLGPITFVLVLNTLTIGLPVLAALAARGQTVFSTILDVDTYLRTSPTNATPRAKIFERYISTLRYLWSYRDEDGDPYEKIVIFAHSLGALISGDLLFYLESEKHSAQGEAAFSSIPITLFTVGNPSRQLLNRFFPYLYSWVRPNPDNGDAPLPSKPGPFAIANHATPDPAKLGLHAWVNAYRSGDYVGRSLWLSEWYERPQYPGSPHPSVASSPDGLRHEFCIGAGAHTRYMDDTAPDIAWMLDSLIRLP